MRNPFRDPVRRPRAVIWLGVVLVLAAFFYVAAQTLTSTFWFCNDVCHTVHADNKAAFYAGSHEKVSCVACHYPVSMNPLPFALDRMDKLLDIPPTIRGTFEMPVNEWSQLALTMPDVQCTQCHNLSTRPVTGTPGIIIEHPVHTDNGVVCATCHNRVAHPEDGLEFTLPGNGPKADFMKMTACFRCHTLTAESVSEFKAPGTCATCHPAGFDLEPESHDAADWYTERGASGGHAEAAREEASRTAEARVEWAAIEEEFYANESRLLVKLAGVDESIKTKVPPPAIIDECTTCHVREEFCDVCHGVQVPHPAAFVENHSKGYTSADAAGCAKCHNKTGDAANDALTCTLCHHPAWDGTGSWRTTHPGVVTADGATECLSCHQETFCSSCHVRGTPSTPY